MRFSLTWVFRLSFLTSLSIATAIDAADCNGNQVEDAVDVESGTSADCNANGIPDECDDIYIQFATFGEHVNLNGSPYDAAYGDIDGDGLLDVVLAVQVTGVSRDRIAVLLADESGALGRPVSTAVSEGASALTPGDFDGDGDLDVAAIDGDTLTILLNDKGVLVEDHSHEFSGNFFDLIALDADGDGDIDLLASNSRTAYVYWFQNSGQADFSKFATLAVGDTPFGLVAGDLDADGHLDLVVANWRSDSISLLYGTGTAFENAVEFALDGSRPRSVHIGDLNGDGHLDLVIPTLETLKVLEGDGERGFVEAASFGIAARSVAIGDADGDGDRDLIVGFSGSTLLAILANDGSGRNFARADVGVGASPLKILPVDWDGDSRSDLIVASRSPNIVEILRGGEISRRISVVQNRYPYGQPPHTADVADMDGDGDLDFVSGNGLRGTVSVLLNDGDGAFRLLGNSPDFGYLNTVVVGDTDNDGDVDVVIADHDSNRVYVLPNRGNGSLAPPANFSVQPSPWFAALADIDRDGYLDIITTSDTRSNVSILINSRNGRFGSLRTLRTGARPTAVAPADYDGDGWIDLAISNENSATLTVYLSVGDGDFAEAETYRSDGRATYIISGDWNGDGHIDLATCNQVGRQVGLFRNNGDGSFAPPVLVRITDAPYSMRAADMDGDGDLDLVTANRSTNSVILLTNSGDGSFIEDSLFQVGTEPRFAPLGDLNGDGSIDIIAANHDSDDISVLLNQLVPPFSGDYLGAVCTLRDFVDISIRSQRASAVQRAGKYIVPARKDEKLLPPLFQNSTLYALHQEFLAQVFPDRFPNLTSQEFDDLVGRKATRDYYVGFLNQVVTAESGQFFTFTVFANTGADFREHLDVEDVRGVYETLGEAFTLRPLMYQPTGADAEEIAEAWNNPGFPIYFDEGVTNTDYEAYTIAVGYGRLRLMDRSAFQEANESGRFTFQDILVLDFAPADIEGVIGGVLTAEPQGDLNHLAVRTARRGTPNAFVSDAISALKSFEGDLVRLEVRGDTYLVERASVEDAESFWRKSRPGIADLPPLDENYRRMDALDRIDLTLDSPESRYGGKASNFARLQRVLTGKFEGYGASGFSIPVHYYLEFIRGNAIASHANPNVDVSYEEYLAELFADPDVLSNSERRFSLLDALRDHMRDEGQVAEGLARSVAVKIASVFGRTDRKVRFRSSSNVEDLLDFNGAGLYESTSACAADDLDNNDSGPSICDVSRDDERGAARAMKRVWSSLWTFRAVEERSYFQIPQDGSAMAILVSDAFDGETANGVAFTGNPSDPLDRRYLISAQIGENSVVSPEPGEIPERNFLSVVGGQLLSIDRSRGSTLVGPGEHVLSDAQLAELAQVMSHMEEYFPLEIDERPREMVLLDLEFKFLGDGSLVIKQVRPFLIPGDLPPTPVFELFVEPGTVACGVFNVEGGRSARDTYENKAILRFVPGTHELQTAGRFFANNLIESFTFGDSQELAQPLGPGVLSLDRLPGKADLTTYSYRYEQEFALEDETIIRLVLRDGALRFQARGDVPVGVAPVLNDEFLTSRSIIIDAISDVPLATFASCGYDLLPLHAILVELENGDRIDLRERFLEPDMGQGEDTGIASLVRGDVEVGGESRRVVDYWKLVYSSRRHNVDVVYWVVLDPPIVRDGLDAPIHVVELHGPTLNAANPKKPGPPSAKYLDENFETIIELSVTQYSREPSDDEPDREFRRGDTTQDGAVDLSDAVSVLNYLFLSGAAPICFSAADADDSGTINLTDAVGILRHLFQGAGPLPAPFASCGIDPTPDELSCNNVSGCR